MHCKWRRSCVSHFFSAAHCFYFLWLFHRIQNVRKKIKLRNCIQNYPTLFYTLNVVIIRWRYLRGTLLWTLLLVLLPDFFFFDILNARRKRQGEYKQCASEKKCDVQERRHLQSILKRYQGNCVQKLIQLCR